MWPLCLHIADEAIHITNYLREMMNVGNIAIISRPRKKETAQGKM